LDDKEASSAAVFQDLSLFTEQEASKMEDEIYIIKSRDFLTNIADKLNLNIQYFTQGRVYESELYKNAPITINFIASDSIINKTNFRFQIDITSDSGFDYRLHEDDDPKQVAFGESITTPFGGMIITPKGTNIVNAVGNQIIVKMVSVNSIAQSLRNRIEIEPAGKSSKVLNITLVDAIPEKAKDIINTLIEEYNKSTVDLKNMRSKNTADFIDSRVELIASDLVNVDDSIVRFKTGNKVTDVSSEAGQFLSSSAQNEQVLDESRTQLRVLNYMKESLGDSNSFEPIPSNLGLGDPSITSLSANYSALLQKRQQLLKSAGEKNLVIVEIDQSLNNIKKSLNQNIENASKSLRIRIGSLENQSSRISSKIYQVPAQTSRLRSIERKQGIKESLYLYLLQKREEATISLTATSPNVKVVDEAYSSGSPVSPNSKMIYIAALFAGLFIPFSILYVTDLLDTKIHNKEDLEATIKDITVLGEIPRLKGKELNALVQRNDRSLLSESFRIIRTNFDYVRRGRHVKAYDNVIFVTSTINGEGKSFFSSNMALTLANTDKRVLLIGADIRNPKTELGAINQKKKSVSTIGLTEYLSDDSVLLGEAIDTYDVGDNKIDVLLAGKIPPNPAELLMSDRMKPLFDKVSEQYDFVIVDTAPSMLVTDTLLFSQFAGHTIYLTRADYTDKQLLNFTKDLHAKNKLNGMMLVVNDVDQSNFGYGARYGYYGAPEKKGFFSRKK
jgi:tyrosine-protein kinase Etk/Wzc